MTGVFLKFDRVTGMFLKLDRATGVFLKFDRATSPFLMIDMRHRDPPHPSPHLCRIDISPIGSGRVNVCSISAWFTIAVGQANSPRDIRTFLNQVLITVVYL